LIGKNLVENYKKILVAFSPVIPHFSSECMEMINIKENLSWPKFDEKILLKTTLNLLFSLMVKQEKL
jgi:leucyl-tRNA synthetase